MALKLIDLLWHSGNWWWWWSSSSS